MHPVERRRGRPTLVGVLSMGDAFDDLEAAVDAALLASVRDAADVIAFEAKASHPYTDRTRDLTTSIEALPAVAGPEGVVGGVIAGEEHASYLERRSEFAFLKPAADRSDARIEHDMDTNLRTATAAR